MHVSNNTLITSNVWGVIYTTVLSKDRCVLYSLSAHIGVLHLLIHDFIYKHKPADLLDLVLFSPSPILCHALLFQH